MAKEAVMEGFLAAFAERLTERVATFEAVLEGLSQEALNWSPGPGLNSLAVLVTHTAGSVRYTMGDVIAGEPSGRVRDNEFKVSDATPEILRQRLADVLAYSLGIVARIRPEELGENRFSPQHNQNFTVAMTLLRTLDHLTEHLGHAEIMRSLWEQKVKSPS